jgi:hypothetical protein
MLTQKVGIKSGHGKYLTSTSGGKITCDKSEIKDNEIFVLKQNGGFVTLKTKFGKYISVNSNNALEAEKDKVTDSEKFQIEFLDNNIFHLKASNGFYVSATKDGKFEVNRKEAKDFETFEFILKEVELLTDCLRF